MEPHKDGNGSGRDPVSGKFLPGHKGGPGRPKRTSPRRDEYRALLEEKTPEILRKVMEMAINGDMSAIRVVLDRVLPVQSLMVEDIQNEIESLREELEASRGNTAH